MDLNKKLEELKPYQLNCNVFDVYSYNGLTMQDLLCQFFTKINECITVSNETIDLAKWLVNEGLELEVVKKLMIWLEDGTLENIINVNIFNTLNEKINGLSSQLEHIKNNNIVSILEFGGVGDGITDNTNAFISAINYANEKGNTTIFINEGVYILSDGDLIPAIKNNNILIKGNGINSILKLKNGVYFKFYGETGLIEGGGLSDLNIIYDYNNINYDSVIVSVRNASSQNYKNLKLLNYNKFLVLGDINLKAYNQRVTNVAVAQNNNGRPCVELVNGAGFYWEDGSGGFVSGVNPPQQGELISTKQDTNFIDIVGNWDTLRLRNFNERWDKVVNIIPSQEKTILNISVDNSLYDYIKTHAINIDVATNSTLNNVSISNTVMNTWENNAINVKSYGYCRHLMFNCVDVQFTGNYGFNFVGNPSHFKIINCKVEESKQPIAVLITSLNYFSIENCEFGSLDHNDIPRKLSLSIVGDCDNFTVFNNKSFKYEINVNDKDSVNRIVKNNLFLGNKEDINVDFYSKKIDIKIPESTNIYTNLSPFEIEYFIEGNIINLYKNLYKISGNYVKLSPGENIVIDYNEKPSINAFILR